ncbi:hypothetical protein D3C77_790580 [compost metagenome]
MPPLLTAVAKCLLGGQRERGLLQRVVNHGLPRCLQLARIDGNTQFGQLQFNFIGVEQLGGEAPQVV